MLPYKHPRPVHWRAVKIGAGKLTGRAGECVVGFVLAWLMTMYAAALCVLHPPVCCCVAGLAAAVPTPPGMMAPGLPPANAAVTSVCQGEALTGDCRSAAAALQRVDACGWS